MMKLLNYKKGFQSYLKLEKSLSSNSIEAYERDLFKFLQFLELRSLNPSPSEVETRHVQDFLAWLYDIKVGARSQARI